MVEGSGEGAGTARSEFAGAGRDEDPWWGVDAALGAAAIVARTAGGVADSVGGTTAARALGGTARWLTRPLAREGEEVRERIEHEAGPAAQQAIRQATPGVVGAIDIDQVLAAIDVNALLDRIDVDRLVDRIDVGRIVDKVDVAALVDRVDVGRIVERVDVDALVQRVDVHAIVDRVDLDALLAGIDVDALVARIDLDALLSKVDLDALLAGVDLDAVLAGVDLNALLSQIDMDALVANTELGGIIAQSTSGVASNVIDGVRSRGVGMDQFLAAVVNRALRRQAAELPAGPPRLVDDRLALPAGEEP